MLSTEFLEFAKSTVFLTTFWLIIALDIWAIGSMIVHFVKWVYGGVKKLKRRETEAKTE